MTAICDRGRPHAPVTPNSSYRNLFVL